MRSIVALHSLVTNKTKFGKDGEKKVVKKVETNEKKEKEPEKVAAAVNIKKRLWKQITTQEVQKIFDIDITSIKLKYKPKTQLDTNKRQLLKNMPPLNFFNSVYFRSNEEVKWQHLSNLIKNEVIRIANIIEKMKNVLDVYSIEDMIEIFSFNNILPNLTMLFRTYFDDADTMLTQLFESYLENDEKVALIIIKAFRMTYLRDNDDEEWRVPDDFL